MEKYKQAIIIRTDLRLPKGKAAAQASHGAVESVLRSNRNLVKEWRNEGQKKIVLKVENEKELFRLNQIAKENGLITALITDAGRTVIAPGTRTCLAIGPDEETKIDSIIKDLKLL